MTRVLHLGDLEIALPLGAALAAWLLAAGARRTALRWGGCFAAVVALVGATKVAHLGWGTGPGLFAFQALSGHAAVVAGLYPFAAWVMLARTSRAAAKLALAGVLLLAAALPALLVASGEHSAAEAAGGWLLGGFASMAGAAAGDELRRARLMPALWWPLPVFVVAAWLMQSAHVGYWMIRLALALSGNSRPYPWDDWDARS